jgi:SAM-dependent methyltransferase
LDHNLKGHFQITGVDLSETMLAMAKQLNPEVEYLLGDMRTVRLDGTFDAVIIADSIDYMLDEADLRRAFQSAYQHLKPGGLFCTYAEETAERFQQNKTKLSTHKSGGIEITTLENYFDPDPSDTTFEMTFVHLIRQEGEFSIEVDRHLSGLFSHAEWVESLEGVGFEVQTVTYVDAGPSFVCKRS